MSGRVELVSTGSELLNGRTLNRHAQVLGSELRPLGLVLARDTTVPDDVDAITEAVRSALSRTRFVVVTGGLGPTSDDVTRDALGRIAGCGQVIDEEALQAIRARYQRTNRKVTPLVERHALVLEKAAVLQNSAGLAPGERIAIGSSTVFLLPGPPREFSTVLEEHVLPWLREHAGQEIPLSSIIQVCGLGESDLVNRLAETGFPFAGVDVAYCAKPGRVEVGLTAPRAAETAFAKARAVLEDKLGEFIFTRDRRRMEEVVGALLLDGKRTLAVAESCTGGMIGARLTEVSGSSAYFKGGVICYSNESKVRDLKVSEPHLKKHGAVSEVVACEMADGVRRRFGSDLGLAVTGIAGPGGGSLEKPVGLTMIALSDQANTVSREFKFGGDRSTVREQAAQLALDLVRRRLSGA